MPGVRKLRVLRVEPVVIPIQAVVEARGLERRTVCQPGLARQHRRADRERARLDDGAAGLGEGNSVERERGCAILDDRSRTTDLAAEGRRRTAQRQRVVHDDLGGIVCARKRINDDGRRRHELAVLAQRGRAGDVRARLHRQRRACHDDVAVDVRALRERGLSALDCQVARHVAREAHVALRRALDGDRRSGEVRHGRLDLVRAGGGEDARRGAVKLQGRTGQRVAVGVVERHGVDRRGAGEVDGGGGLRRGAEHCLRVRGVRRRRVVPVGRIAPRAARRADPRVDGIVGRRRDGQRDRAGAVVREHVAVSGDLAFSRDREQGGIARKRTVAEQRVGAGLCEHRTVHVVPEGDLRHAEDEVRGGDAVVASRVEADLPAAGEREAADGYGERAAESNLEIPIRCQRQSGGIVRRVQDRANVARTRDQGGGDTVQLHVRQHHVHVGHVARRPAEREVVAPENDRTHLVDAVAN